MSERVGTDGLTDRLRKLALIYAARVVGASKLAASSPQCIAYDQERERDLREAAHLIELQTKALEIIRDHEGSTKRWSAGGRMREIARSALGRAEGGGA